MNFGVVQINNLYGLINPNIADFKAKGCDPGCRMVGKLCPRKKVPWAVIKKGISMNDFIVEAHIWMNII